MRAATLAAAAGRLRPYLLPLGLCALIAVGVHASADVLADRVLRAADFAFAAFDSLVSRWTLTAPLVDFVGPVRRTSIARALALVWELAADAVLALPMLGYEERPGELERARALVRKAFRRPAPREVLGPVCTAAVSIAGACSTGRLVRSTLLFFPALANLAALLTLLLAIALFSFRATLQSLEHAAAPSRRRTAAGLVTALFALPVAVAAVVGASPLLSFFR